MKPVGQRLWPEEAERAVLSAILGAACVTVDTGHKTLAKARAAGLHPAHFWLTSHAQIYAAMTLLHDLGEPVDPVSVAAELDPFHEDPTAVSRLRVLTAELALFTAVERYARIVVDAATRREIEERGAA